MDCGPTCLRMIAEYYGKRFDVAKMQGITKIKKEGSSLLQLVDAANALGLSCEGLQMEITCLCSTNLPVILHWDQHHFVVLFKVQRNTYFIADPSSGIFRLTQSELLSHWYVRDQDAGPTGILLTFSM